MINKVLLFPYWIVLKIRHLLFDKGICKVHKTEVPSICIGNITVGGTGKTPHTEMLLRILLRDEIWSQKEIAVLSRGYKRQTKGFQQVTIDGTAREYGDEPMQIKHKFPSITVAVDNSRKEGCDFLCNPEKLKSSPKGQKCKDKNLHKADLIILDDAFQHRSIKADVSILLVDYNRPLFKDHLMPLGRLRDLPERIEEADIVIVTKCPPDLNPLDMSNWAEALGIKLYDTAEGCGTRKSGKHQHLFFTKICYDSISPVFYEGDHRYVYSKNLILITGIANNFPFRHYLSGEYKIIKHLNFPDHHKFSKADIKAIEKAASASPTAVVMTTEKDCQRLRDYSEFSDNLKKKMFYIPIKSEFISEQERDKFITVLKSYLK